jgi:hypothetical protein
LGFCAASLDELRLDFSKLVQDITPGVNAESNPIDVRVAGESSTCCGVNLACAALGVMVLAFGFWFWFLVLAFGFGFAFWLLVLPFASW